MQNEQNDMVNHPPHYTRGGIECADAQDAAIVGLVEWEASGTASAIKYLWRWKFKGGKQDLEKAISKLEVADNRPNLPSTSSKEEEK